MLLPPGYVAAVKAHPNLDHDARVSMLAATLILREGAPLDTGVVGCDRHDL